MSLVIIFITHTIHGTKSIYVYTLDRTYMYMYISMLVGEHTPKALLLDEKGHTHNRPY